MSASHECYNVTPSRLAARPESDGQPSSLISDDLCANPGPVERDGRSNDEASTWRFTRRQTGGHSEHQVGKMTLCGREIMKFHSAGQVAADERRVETAERHLCGRLAKWSCAHSTTFVYRYGQPATSEAHSSERQQHAPLHIPLPACQLHVILPMAERSAKKEAGIVRDLRR